MKLRGTSMGLCVILIDRCNKEPEFCSVNVIVGLSVLKRVSIKVSIFVSNHGLLRPLKLIQHASLLPLPLSR